jgi:hypothetical protein
MLRRFLTPLRISTAAVTMFSFLAAAGSALAQDELVPPRVTDRKYPQGVYCPLPVDVAFTADGATATIRFSTHTVFFTDPFNDVQWSQQEIDNIGVSLESVYQANLGPLGPNSNDCYFDDDLPATFYFQNAGTLPLLEKFDTDPGALGWDLAHGAYWSTSNTAPNDPGSDSDYSSIGCLGIGEDAPSPAERDLADSAYTTIRVEGLTAGQSYRLTGWWNVQQMELDEIFLTIRIFGDEATEITRATFGGLKARYRDGHPAVTRD